MIDMGMRVDDGGDRPVAPVPAHEIERGARRLGGDQRVYDDVTPLAFDEGDVRKIEIAHLIDALRHLEEAVDRIEPRLTPETRVDRIGCVLLRLEGKLVHIPDRMAGRIADRGAGDRGDEAAPGILKILARFHGQPLTQRRMRAAGCFGCVLRSFHGSPLDTNGRLRYTACKAD